MNGLLVDYRIGEEIWENVIWIGLRKVIYIDLGEGGEIMDIFVFFVRIFR